LDIENEGVGLNMYNSWVTDPYAANALHSEIVTDINMISANIKKAMVEESF
jgi:hypothetical protein